LLEFDSCQIGVEGWG